MSTLKTHNLQSSDSGSVNIAMTPNAGMVVAGISTFNNRVLIGTNIEGHVDADDLTIGSSTNTAGITIRTNTAGTGRLWFSDGTSGAAEYQGYVQYDHNNQRLSLGSGGSTKLHITSEGNVIIAETMAVNRPRIVLSAPNDGTNYRHLFGANLQVDSSGTFTTPTANISGGGWEYLPANSLNDHGDLRYLSAPDTNSTSSTPLERLRIASNGNLTQTGSGNIVHYINTGNNSGDNSTIAFGDSADADAGHINYDHGTNAFQIRTNGASNSVVITNEGEMQLSGDANPVLSVNRGGSNTTNINIKYNGSTRSQLSAASNGFEISAVGSTAPIQFFTNGSERLRIGSSGQIGLGGANYGTSGQVLTSQGSSSAVQWATPASNSPAFQAYRSSTYTATNGSAVVLDFDQETFDTDSCYNHNNGRFTPTTSGYYIFYLNYYWSGSSSNNIKQAHTFIRKNGSDNLGQFWTDPHDSYRDNRLGMSVTCAASMNGSSDYVEAIGYCLINGGNPYFNASGAVFGGFKLAT